MTNPEIDVRKEDETIKGVENAKDKKFKTIISFKDDLKGLYKPPISLWDDSFIGEAISDECHPENSSFVIGASGGVITGLVTGFFSTSRVPLPIRTPIPGQFLPSVQRVLRNSIISSSVLWRVAKRSLLGTILFAVLECDFKEFVKKPSDKWKGSLVAGAVCGSVFGLRGGLPGMLMGAGIFTALPGGWEVYTKKEQIRSKIFNP